MMTMMRFKIPHADNIDGCLDIDVDVDDNEFLHLKQDKDWVSIPKANVKEIGQYLVDLVS